MRAAQSKGKVDLLTLWPLISPPGAAMRREGLINRRPPWLVQCKTGSARMSPADRADLIDLAHQTGGVPVLAEPGPKNRGVTFTNLITKEIL